MLRSRIGQKIRKNIRTLSKVSQFFFTEKMIRVAAILTLLPALAWSACSTDTIELPLTSELGGLRFVGLTPNVSRFPNAGMVSKTFCVSFTCQGFKVDFLADCIVEIYIMIL